MADEIKNNIPEEEEEDDIIELTDDEGNTVRFNYLTTIDYEGELYVLVTEDDGNDDSEEADMVILKIEKDEETQEDIYVTVDDEAIGDAVFAKFMDMLNDEEDEE